MKYNTDNQNTRDDLLEFVIDYYMDSQERINELETAIYYILERVAVPGEKRPVITEMEVHIDTICDGISKGEVSIYQLLATLNSQNLTAFYALGPIFARTAGVKYADIKMMCPEMELSRTKWYWYR